MASGNEPVRTAVLLLCGLPGSGKTTFAHALLRMVPALHIESDAIRREIFPTPKYTNAENRVVFAEVERRAAKGLAARMPVIVDATNLAQPNRNRFHALAERERVPIMVLRLVAPANVVRDRLTQPRNGFSQANVDVYERMAPSVERPARAITVDSRFSFEPTLRLLSRLLKESE